MNAKKNLSGYKADDGMPRPNAAERVFDTARELFYNRGVRAVGVDEIVTQAGVTKPSLYRAFPSKDELVAACLQQSAKEVSAALDGILTSSADPLTQLRTILDLFAARMAQPGFRGCALSNTAVEFPEPDHPSRAVLEFCKTAVRDKIVGVTRQLPIRNPDALADGLVMIIEGAMASHHIFGSQGPSATMAANANALIDAYLNAPA